MIRSAAMWAVCGLLFGVLIGYKIGYQECRTDTAKLVYKALQSQFRYK